MGTEVEVANGDKDRKEPLEEEGVGSPKVALNDEEQKELAVIDQDQSVVIANDNTDETLVNRQDGSSDVAAIHNGEDATTDGGPVTDNQAELIIPVTDLVVPDEPLLTSPLADKQPSTYSFIPRSLFLVLVVAGVILSRVYQRRPRWNQSRVPSHEELRKLREAHLDSHTTTKPTISPTTENEDKDLTKGPETEKTIKENDPTDATTVMSKKPIRLRATRADLTRSAPPRKWQPLRTSQELMTWTPSGIIQRPTPLRQRRKPSPKRLMLCHDMAGNYAEDAFVDGWYSKSSSSKDAAWAWGFRPCHFAFTDAFVYFSHEFISIPPLGWIDAAHRHGCKVLGTFLTEWDAGFKLCEDIFSSRETTEQAAAKLGEISSFYGFDGWLINIENRLDPAEVMVPNVLRFLELLSSSSSNMLIVWYDSVVNDTGDLKWQNGLNDRNIAFFNASNGGILTNYGWNEERVKTSNAFAQRHKGNKNSNINQDGMVWHGIDVFGRGTFGGGGMHCDLALNLLDKYASDCACLFAPGWVLENAAEKNPLLGKRRWQEFFDKIIRNTAWGEGDAGCFTVKTSVTSRGLFTDFCDGGGSSLWANGERLSASPWMDLRRQSLQPRWDVITPEESENKDVKTQRRVTIRSVETAPVFSGSSAIQLVGRRQGQALKSWFFFPLVSLEARLGGDQGPASKLRIRAAILPLNGDVALSLDVAPREPSKPLSRLKLVPRDCAMEDTLPAVEEHLEHGWVVRTWELRTYDLRGRSLLGMAVSPLPVSSSTSSWMEVRVGMLSLDETMRVVDKCRPSRVSVDPKTLMLTWECAECQGDGDYPCAMEHVLVFVNSKFRQCAANRPPSSSCQLNELLVLSSGQVEDVVTVKAVRWDGSITEEIRAK